MSKIHLGSDAAAPLTAAEAAALGQQHQSGGDQDAGSCVMPVPDKQEAPFYQKDKREADHSYAYRAADGGLLGYVLRWDARNGQEKGFWPCTLWRNGKQSPSWELKSWPAPRPLYGLDRLARHPDAIVLLTEGEKAADAVEFGPLADAFKWAKQPVIGMTWPGGAKAIDKIDFKPLAGRNVIILPDNDQHGEQAADRLVDILQQIGARQVRRWKAPATAKEKWDIADEIPAGIAADALVRSVLEAGRIVLTLVEFLAEYIPPDYLIDGLLQRHYFYSLTGMTGAGKTAAMLLIAVKVAILTGGQKLGPHNIEHGRVVYITKENPTDVRMRLIGMCTKYNIDPARLDFHVVEKIDDIAKDLPSIVRDIEALGPVALVVVDTSPALFTGDDENSNKQLGDHARNIRKLCDLPGHPCVVALCHPTKRPNGKDDLLPRGGGAYLNEVDGNLALWGHDEKLADLHWCGKFRGPDFEPIVFRMETITTTKLADSKGKLLPTVMAKLVTDAEAAANEQDAIAQERRLLIAMHNRPRGSLTEWADDCRWFLEGDPAKPNKRRAQGIAERLKDSKLVKSEGRVLTLTPAGTKAAKKAIDERAPDTRFPD